MVDDDLMRAPSERRTGPAERREGAYENAGAESDTGIEPGRRGKNTTRGS